MIKNLIKVANRLDSLGFKKEADELDRIIKKIAISEEETVSAKGVKESIEMYRVNQARWIKDSSDFLDMARGAQSAMRDEKFPGWSDDDFKTVIYAVDGEPNFWGVFGYDEADRIHPMAMESTGDDITYLKAKEDAMYWSDTGLSDVDDEELEFLRSYLDGESIRKTGLYGFNNGSYTIIPHNPKVKAKKYIKQREGEGARTYSGLRHKDAIEKIEKLINDFKYLDAGLPVFDK